RLGYTRERRQAPVSLNRLRRIGSGQESLIGDNVKVPGPDNSAERYRREAVGGSDGGDISARAINAPGQISFDVARRISTRDRRRGAGRNRQSVRSRVDNAAGTDLETSNRSVGRIERII